MPAPGGRDWCPAQLRSPASPLCSTWPTGSRSSPDSSYFAQFSSASPLQQTWSLAIEEQYYVVWPLLLGALTWVFAWAAGPGRVGLISTVAALAAASAVWMGVAAHLFGPNRAYLGTDTRAWELLLGGAWRCRSGPSIVAWPDHTSRVWAALGPVGLVGVAAGAAWAGGADGPPSWIWDGGLVAIALCAGLVVLSCLLAPNAVMARTLPSATAALARPDLLQPLPLAWPVIVLMTPDSTGLEGGGLLMARTGGHGGGLRCLVPPRRAPAPANRLVRTGPSGSAPSRELRRGRYGGHGAGDPRRHGEPSPGRLGPGHRGASDVDSHDGWDRQADRGRVPAGGHAGRPRPPLDLR